MTVQFGRKVSLIVAPPSGNGIEIAALRIVFQVQHWSTETPNSMVARIYNLSEETAQLIQKEFTRVVLRAGYEGNFGIIFDGSITLLKKGSSSSDVGDVAGTRTGYETPVDTYLDIFAADGDDSYNWGVINTTLAAGHTLNDINKAIGQAFLAQDATGTFKTDDLPDTVPQTASPRGRVLFGMAREHARTLAERHGMDWGIRGGVLEWLPQSAYKPGDAVVLNSDTGLIGTPEQTQDGINVRCLLNPSIGQGTRIQIDNKAVAINRAARNTSYLALNALPEVSHDGFYKVIYVDHSGDTRGDMFYSNMLCLAIDSTIQPISGSVLGVGIPP